MTEYLTVAQVIDLHRRVIEEAGGSHGLRDAGSLASAVVQPAVTFGGMELYTDIAEKAAALGFSLILNHPFIDGNKRVGHASIDAFLEMNGFRLNCNIDEQESVILGVAAGTVDRDSFTAWIRAHISSTNAGVESA